ERVVHREADAVHPLRHLVARERGERERERIDEALALLHQPLALLHGLARDEELTLPKVTETTMHELRRPARRPGREVLRLDEERLLPVTCGLTEDPGA